jgi:S1-C subfamily serine protease
VNNQVTPGCPAERAGFAPGDVVTEFDGKPVESVKEVTRLTSGCGFLKNYHLQYSLFESSNDSV